MSTNSPVVRVKEKIDLTEKEKMIFDRLLATVGHFDLSTRLRVAGGWVRDKVGVFGSAVRFDLPFKFFCSANRVKACCFVFLLRYFV